MVRGYHVIFCCYGFWLPNDPRGSWSDWIGSWELLRFGRATTTHTRRSVAAARHDPAQRAAAKRALRYPPVALTGPQAAAVAAGFADYARTADLALHACAVLPEHVHLVVARHPRLRIESIVNQLKGAATRRLIAADLHPLTPHARPGQRPPTCWARGQWAVYLNTPADITHAIRYVERNPVKEGKQPQRWRFVTPYDGGA